MSRTNIPVPRVLLDVDGVLANWTASAIDVAAKITGKFFSMEELCSWNIFETIGHEHYEACNEAFQEEGFCASIQPYAPALSGFRMLREHAEVFVVTSATHSKYWHYERCEWLKKHFDIDPSRICFTDNKHHVRGDIFVDDKLSNVWEWYNCNKDRVSLLWAQPYNKLDRYDQSVSRWPATCRIDGWSSLIDVARTFPAWRNYCQYLAQ